MKIPPEQLVAHRGHQDQFPENSILAILDAIAAGAKNIEFDIQYTKDGHVALYHDANMQRISDVEYTITELTKDELKQYSAKEPKRLGRRFTHNPIEYLDQLIPIIVKHHDITFFIEIKEESLHHFGSDFCFNHLKLVLGNTVPNNLILISFDLEAVKRAKEEGFAKTALVFRDWAKRDELLAEANADYGFTNYTRIPPRLPITASRPIMVYEVRYPLIAIQLLERGAAAVETFCIRALLSNS